MVLMSLASARCQPLSVKRLMWAARSEVTAMPFRGHPLACTRYILLVTVHSCDKAGTKTHLAEEGSHRQEREVTSRLLIICLPKASLGFICTGMESIFQAGNCDWVALTIFIAPLHMTVSCIV